MPGLPITVAVLLAVAPPSAEALVLGQKLAEQGTLAAVLPLIAGEESKKMVAEASELTEAEKETLRATAAETAREGTARIISSMGRVYADQLSVEELRALVAFNDTAAAKRHRAVQPAVIMGTMATMGKMDLKADTMAAFCKKTGKLCAVDAE